MEKNLVYHPVRDEVDSGPSISEEEGSNLLHSLERPRYHQSSHLRTRLWILFRSFIALLIYSSLLMGLTLNVCRGNRSVGTRFLK